VPKFVYDFTEGNKDLKDLLGGKGANLAEMTNIGLPVPPGFTITTDACRHYLRHGGTPDGLDAEVTSHLAAVEEAMGRTLGDPADPLLVSVRSGAKFSMPGMMDTILNIGLSDDSVHFFHEVGLDNVSCSPFRVPVARLEAGRAAVTSGGSDTR
jgi:pyruvate,orthophosphate dikinase